MNIKDYWQPQNTEEWPAQSSDAFISDFWLPELYTYTKNILFLFFPSIPPIPSPYLPKLVRPYGLVIYLISIVLSHSVCGDLLWQSRKPI